MCFTVLVQTLSSVCQCSHHLLCYFLLPGRQGPVGFGCRSHSIQLALSGTVEDTMLPPVDLHPPTATPFAQPIHNSPALIDCVTV